MSVQANTRLFKGSILKVDDLDSGYITTGEITKVAGFGAPSSEINASTAASTIDEFRLGLPDFGDATIDCFLNMDDDFQKEMEIMRDSQETRTFKLVMPEGTKKIGTFSAYVIDGNIVGAYNDLYKYTLVLGMTSAIVWAIT